MEEKRIGNRIFYLDRTEKILLTKSDYLEGRKRYVREVSKLVAKRIEDG